MDYLEPWVQCKLSDNKAAEKEANPKYPQLEEFASLDEWATDVMMKDHEEYLR